MDGYYRRDGTWVRGYTQKRRAAAPGTSYARHPVPPRARTRDQIPAPRAAVRLDRQSERIPQKVVDAATEVLTDGWSKVVANQLNAVLWGVVRPKKVRRASCHFIAEIADGMEQVKSEAHSAVGALAAVAGVKILGFTSLEGKIAGAIAGKIPIPGEESISLGVQKLRIFGVWVCVIGGQSDPVVSCPCFRALAKERSEEEIQRLLESKFNELSGRN
ncbi:hypothetical protein [Pseudonocardia sp. NPDC049635]|uniref:hypothetical protein n=1 Tax=Pseudonocardia sp. NPDC049635 TaxID=3155506 RepID=UPI0033CCC752